MNRKTFLGTLVVLPIGMFLVNCSSSSSSSDANAPATLPIKSGTQTVYTSNNSGLPTHAHTFGIDDMSITSPPSAGVSNDTSSVSSHSHSVSISMAELAQMAAGQSVSITTTNVSSHVHVFTFMKIT